MAKIKAILATSSLLGALLSAGCLSSPGQEDAHWNVESLSPRMARNFLGYREDLDGDFRDFQYRQKQDINLTMRRHFLNNNPANPFEGDDPSLVAPRPPHSVLPDPVSYFHVESIAIGLATLAATGAFIPIPINSLAATFSEGGDEEFVEGIVGTVNGSFSGGVGEPAPVEEFRVRNVR